MITQKYLKSKLTYNPETGIFKWNSGRSKTGTIDNHGYMRITIDGSKYSAARLAFLYMTGKFPENTVDHINRDRTDNRWSNLRDVSYSLNNSNRGLQSNNVSGYPGVRYIKSADRWQSRIKVDKKDIYIGRFKTRNEAVKARINMEVLHDRRRCS